MWGNPYTFLPRNAGNGKFTCCQRNHEIDGHSILVGASVGIAVAPDDGLDPDDLLRLADMALYRSKELGRGIHSFFEPGMNQRMQERSKLETDLRKAIAAGEFEVFYQPVVKAGSGEIGSFEALLRWRHPERGLLKPADFLQTVEEIGLIGSRYHVDQLMADPAELKKLQCYLNYDVSRDSSF